MPEDEQDEGVREMRELLRRRPGLPFPAEIARRFAVGKPRPAPDG